MTNKDSSRESIELFLILKYGSKFELYTKWFNAHMETSKGMKSTTPDEDIELIGIWMDYERDK